MRVFAPEQDGFFDDLVTMLVSLSSFMFTMHVSLYSNRPTPFERRSLAEWISYIAPIKTPGFSYDLGCTDGTSIVFSPTLVLGPPSLGGWPLYIEYEHRPYPQSPPDARLTSDGIRRITSGIVGASFTNYYAGCDEMIKALYGTNRDRWPETIRFSWCLRNGFAHGGKINITDPNLRPATWRSFSLDASYNGRTCLFDQETLGPGDVILLMQDVDELVRPHRESLSQT